MSSYPMIIEFDLKNINTLFFNKIVKNTLFDKNFYIIKSILNKCILTDLSNNYKLLEKNNNIILSSLDEKRQLILSFEGKYNSLHGDCLYFHQEHIKDKNKNKELFSYEQLLIISYKIKKILEFYLGYNIQTPRIFTEYL